MEILEAIQTRKSIRKFKSDPVPRKILKDILETAVRAPSSENTQPWEFIVMDGEVLEKVKDDNVQKISNFESPPPEMAHIMINQPKGSVYRKRQVENGKRLFGLMGIAKDDTHKRGEWLKRGFRYFDAPAVIIIAIDKSLPEASAFFDVGGVAQTICLAALEYGIYSCIENQGVTYSDIIKKYTGLPESKKPVVAIALGYPDWDFPANNFKSEREPVEETIVWTS